MLCICACATAFFAPFGMRAESTNAAAAQIKSNLPPGLTTTTSAVPHVAATNHVSREPVPSYWQTLRAEETYREKVRRDAEQRRQEDELLKEAMRLANVEHARIKAERNPPPPPPRFIDEHNDVVVVAFVMFLFTVVTKLALDRHREQAEIRALTGGYLSDGTEVARFAMPDLFGSAELDDVPHEGWTAKGDKEAMVQQPDPLAGFFEEAPKTLNALSDLLKDLNGAAEPDQKRVQLLKMADLAAGLVPSAGKWLARPAWQVSTALDLLIRRVADKPKDATVSVFRTIASGIDCLRTLCVPGIRSNLITEPALKILAADDDALCRRAVAFALQKAGLSADFAENGEQAVTMASAASYDMFFLDIQMPQMDGLAACAKIREMPAHADTPVVFVTVQSDFLTRAQTTAIGGSDFIAKPFLVFEITVKAVVSAVRKRLAMLPRKAGSAEPSHSQSALTVARRKSKPSATAEEQADLKDCFFRDAEGYIGDVAELVNDISAMPDGDERKRALGDLHVRLLTFAAAARLNDLAVTTRTASAVESLAKKLGAAPKNVTASALRTMAQALELLKVLCEPGTDAQLTASGPVRLLVVEDEPLARRAVVGALQLAFDRPDAADDGATAMRMAAKRRYDVIFSDIEMPELDGLELGRKIRATGPSSAAPIVFITNHADAESRIQAAEVGETDFIAKPFLPVEITVKALTLAYTHRLSSTNEARQELATA